MKVSVVSTFYNDEKMLRVVLESVLKQDYNNIEHCIADGGSNDGTVEILEEYEKKYENVGKRLIWKSEKDRGISDGVNKAVNMATGDLIIICTDRYFDNTVISQMVEHLQKTQSDYIYGGVLFQKDGIIIRQWSGKPGNWRLGWIAATPTIMFKKSLWKIVGPFDEKYKSAADYKFQVNLFKNKSLKSSALVKPLVIFSAGGASNGGIKGKLASIAECHNILKDCKVRFGWFTNICKTFIALFAYTFASHKKINMEE